MVPHRGKHHECLSCEKSKIVFDIIHCFGYWRNYFMLFKNVPGTIGL